jgi:hypothetical protein
MSSNKQALDPSAPVSRVGELFSWWAEQKGGDENIANLLEVPRQTIWRWRTGVIQNLRPSDRREVARQLRVSCRSLQQFLDREIELEVLIERQGEQNVPLEQLLNQIDGRPPHELVQVNFRVATLLAGVSGSPGSKKNPRPIVPDTLGEKYHQKTIKTVICLKSFNQARRLGNLIKVAQKELGLDRKGYLQLVSGGDQASLEAATLFYADVMDETLRAHAVSTYQLFCPHLFRLIKWQGEAQEEPLVDFGESYLDAATLLADLELNNSRQDVTVR